MSLPLVSASNIHGEKMYVTYDLRQKTAGDDYAVYPQVTRVSIAGDVVGWQVGHFRTGSGKDAFGVKIDYEQRREGDREPPTVRNTSGSEHESESADEEPKVSTFSELVELPEEAQNIQFHRKGLPPEYRDD